MTDYTELKRMAEHMNELCGNHDGVLTHITTGAVLALIAENDRLRSIHAVGPVKVAFDVMDERDQLKADKEALVAAYARAGEREHELRVERSTLREAVKFAVETFSKITSSDGSGHADLSKAVLRIAGSAMGQEEQP